MIGLGTIVNVIAIIVGSIVGILIGHNIPKRVHDILIKGLGLFTIAIGMKMFVGTEQLIIILLSILVGGACGELLGIEKRLENFGAKIKSITKIKESRFIDGFMTASLVYCIGPIAIMGSLYDGISANHELLLIKSILDGTASIGFAAGLGVGVLFSFVPVLIYQGAITIAAMHLGHLFSSAMIAEITAAGGILMLGLGINLLGSFGERGRIPGGNFLPAIANAPLLTWLIEYLQISL